MAATTTGHMAYQDVAVGGIEFRLSRRALSAFVGIEVASGAHAGEIFAYIADLNSETPDQRWFRPRLTGWPADTSQQLATMLRLVREFHIDMRRAEVVTGDGW